MLDIFCTQGDGRTVRDCFIQFALSFLVVGSHEVVQRILHLRGTKCATQLCVHVCVVSSYHVVDHYVAAF